MRQLLVLIFLFAFNAGTTPFLHAESNDPSDLFLNAYMSVQKGQKLEEDGKFKLALQKYRYAATLLQQVRDKYPDWQPLIVDYRLKKTSDAIAAVEQKIAVQGPGSTQDVEPPPLPVRTDDGSTTDTTPNSPTVVTPGNNTGKKDPFEDMRAQYEQMKRELSDVKQKYADVQRDKELLLDKLNDAIKDRDKSRVAEAQAQSALKQAEQAYKDAVSEKSMDTEGQKQMKDEVARLQNLIKDIQAERDVADEQNEDNKRKLAALREERNVAMKERDDAVGTLKKAMEGQQQLDKLMAENTALTQKLADAEKTIAGFTASAPAKDAEIAALKKEVADTREQLSAALKQSQENLHAMTDMQDELEKATTALSNMNGGVPLPDDQKKIIEENALLKGIVIRVRKEGAHRDQEKQLALEELAKLNIHSESLEDRLKYLGQPVIQLTEEERKLFKRTDISISDNGGEIVAENPGNSAPLMTPPPAPVATPATNSITMPPVATPAPANPAETVAATPAPSLPAATPADSGDTTPRVQTKVNPPVSEELIPQANEAKDAFDRGRYGDAEKIYLAMLSKEPKNVYVLSNLGVVQFRSGKLKPAEATFRKALAFVPDDSFSRRTLGIIYYSQGKFDDALGELTKALVSNPKDAIAHNYLGITVSEKGWQEAAREELEKAVALDPNYSDAHFNLSVIMTRFPPIDKEGAKKHYKRAVELGAPSDPALEQLLNK